MEITLKTNEAVSIASLSEFAQKGRDAHPELARVYLSVADGKLKALATDRYTMASYSIDLAEDVTADFVLSVNACKWLMTNIKKTTIGDVVLTKTEDSLVITTANGSFNDELIESEKGKTFLDFIDEKTKEEATEAYPVKLTVAHLLKLGKLSSNFGKVETITQTLTPQERENRAGPMKLTSDNFSVIIQPRNN